MVESDQQNERPKPSHKLTGEIPSHGSSVGGRFPSLKTLVTMALALLLYLALLDAVLETFLSGSPLRWIVAGLAIGYMVAIVLLWKRLRWAGKATSAVFAILVLLALTAWLPAGLTQGVTLLRQQTSAVLAMVTALAIAMSAIVLIRSGLLPHVGGWVVGFLAAYSVLAFIQAAVVGTSYPDLFHGNSLWTPLPFWLQGAIIGSLVLVPAAILVQIVGVLRLRGTETRKEVLLQTFGLCLSLVIAVAGFRMPAFSYSPTVDIKSLEEPMEHFASALAGHARKGQLSSKQIADLLEKPLDVAERVIRDAPRETFDIQSITQRLGREPSTIFRWVRDETLLVPYHGVLRGARGVLMDRLGNSLDRALLLIGLLESIGEEARLARGLLSEEKADELLRVIPAEAKGRMIANLHDPRRSIDNLVREIAQQYQLEPQKVRELFSNVGQPRQRVIGSVRARASEQARAIALGIGSPSTKETASARSAARAALRDHWWVQLRQGNDWIDLDPTMPNAELGRTLTTFQNAVEPKQLSSDLYHEVHLSVIIEQWEQGQLKEKPVLRHVLRPLELYGIRVALAHYPVKWPDESIPSSGENLFERLRATVLAQTEWIPTLELGDNPVVQSSFTDSGEVNSKPLDSILGSGGQTVGRKVEDILRSGGVGRQPGRETAQKTHLTAEWIEYEIRSPGRNTRKVRREVFDLLGPAARSAATVLAPEISETAKAKRGLALLGETEILPMASQLSPAFVEDLFARRLLDNREILLRMVPDGSLADIRPLIEQASRLAAVSPILHSLAIARSEWSQHREVIYLDQPNIFTFFRRLLLNNLKEIGFQSGFDIIVNDVAVLPLPGIDPFTVRIKQGVLETNAEALFVKLICGASEVMSCSGPVENTAELFAISNERGVEWLKVQNVQDQTLGKVELSQDARALIERDLTEGYTVLVPRRPISVEGGARTGWWRVDPQTGHVLGMSESGGASTVEHMLARRLTAGQKHVIGVALLNGWFAGLYLQSCYQSGGGTGYCFAKFLCLAIGFGFAFAAGMTGFIPVAAYAAAATNGACRMW